MNFRRCMLVPALCKDIVAAQLGILEGHGECPLWVISRHFAAHAPCPLCPQKRTSTCLTKSPEELSGLLVGWTTNWIGSLSAPRAFKLNRPFLFDWPFSFCRPNAWQKAQQYRIGQARAPLYGRRHHLLISDGCKGGHRREDCHAHPRQFQHILEVQFG
jgi:hypothetical protein